MINFCSDNVTEIAPEILAALVAANRGTAMPYGNDDESRQLETRLAEVFEAPVYVIPVATGSAANALALAALSPPYGAIYCHAESHIYTDECGAPEFYTGGAKLLPLPGEHGKLSPTTLATALERGGAGIVHHVQPAAVSLTQATEAGTVYTPTEVQTLARVAQDHNLPLHMDGARFANALSHLGCTPAELTWKAGVEVLTLGATKNGAMAAEAIIFFNPERAAALPYRQKRGGHLWSKARFLSVQLLAYLENNLWLRHAAQANARAQQLAGGLAQLPGVSLCHPVEANEVFVYLPEALICGLLAAGFQFYRWEGEASPLVRLVTAYSTTAAEVDQFLTVAQQLSDSTGALPSRAAHH